MVRGLTIPGRSGVSSSMRPFCLCGLLVLVFSLHAADESLAPAVECRERSGLPNFFGKLKGGGEVRVAYLGGSITAQEGWRPKTLNWFAEQFPSAKVKEINAAIGGTGSDLGAFRLRHDALAGQPDLLFVEFAVNDAGAPPQQIRECMEGIVRQTLKDNRMTDICFVYTIASGMLETLQAGHFPRSATAMEQVAAHYGIPSIHVGVEVARLEKAGRLVFKGDKPKTEHEKTALGDKILFSPDAVHPYTDTGHELYLQAVVRSMAKIRDAGAAGPHELPFPLEPGNWEEAKMIPLSRAKLSAGWQKLDPEANPIAKRFSNRLPELWMADEAGEHLEFSFRGRTARIYDIVGPDCGQVTVTVDDEPAAIRPRFDAYCTYHRLATLAVAGSLPETIHRVRVTTHPDQPDKARILSTRNEKMDDPKRFDGRAWYAGSLLLVGEIVD